MSVTRLEELRRHYQLTEVTVMQKLFFMVSLCYQPLLGGNFYDEIVPGIILGRIPTVEDAKKMKETIPNLGLVVSVVEDFELNGKVLAIDLGLQSPAGWEKLHVKHHQLIATDFTADMAIEDTIKTLRLMNQAIENGESVYIHCKAGRGRSATLVLLYLLFYGSADLKAKANIDEVNQAGISDGDIQEVYNYMKKRRIQVGLYEHNFDKISKVIHAEKKFPQKKDTGKPISNDLFMQLNDYFSSIECKEQICQMNAFKLLKFYAIDKGKESNRGKQIQKLLDEIIDATNANWLITLMNGDGPLKNLLEARPYNGFLGIGKPNKRLQIVEDFKHDLMTHLSKLLKCNAEHLVAMLKSADLNKGWQLTLKT